jgi:hypothetical protein
MAQQIAILHLRQEELEQQVRSIPRLYDLLIRHEDVLRPDAACGGGEEDLEDLVG